MTDKPSTYSVRSTAPHWFVIDIVKPDGSKHLVGGFPTQEAALEWIKDARSQISARHRLRPGHRVVKKDE